MCQIIFTDPSLELAILTIPVCVCVHISAFSESSPLLTAYLLHLIEGARGCRSADDLFTGFLSNQEQAMAMRVVAGRSQAGVNGG